MAVRRRGNKWIAEVYDPSWQGRKRRLGTFDTQKAARAAEAAALLERKREGKTVGAYAATWIETHPRPRRATDLHYADVAARFAREFGARRLDSFTPQEAREYALVHVSYIGVICSMFSDARRDGLIGDNPFVALRVGRGRGRRDLEVLSVDQVTKLADVARTAFGPNFAAFILTAAYTGMRPGELYALKWPRVRFDRDEIEVAYSYSTRARETTPPKTGHHRTIVLFPEAAAALKQIPRLDREGHVFLTTRRRPLNAGTLHSYWNPVRIAAGLPGIDLYELRHFCAARLLNDLGHEAEDVALQLGHTDGGALIRKLYGHPSETLARDRLKRGFGRKGAALSLVRDADEAQKAL